MTSDPKAIWLSPKCDLNADHGEGRSWANPAPEDKCEDCGEPWVKYVRSDLIDRIEFALAYLGSCTAATAEGLLDRKSSPKGELRRHRSICNMLLSALRGEDIERRLGSSSIVGTESRLRDVITRIDTRLNEGAGE